MHGKQRPRPNKKYRRSCATPFPVSTDEHQRNKVQYDYKHQFSFKAGESAGQSKRLMKAPRTASSYNDTQNRIALPIQAALKCNT